MELTGNVSSPKLLTYPKYARLLEAGASKTSCLSSLVLECAGMTLLQDPLKSIHQRGNGSRSSSELGSPLMSFKTAIKINNNLLECSSLPVMIFTEPRWNSINIFSGFLTRWAQEEQWCEEVIPKNIHTRMVFLSLKPQSNRIFQDGRPH